MNFLKTKQKTCLFIGGLCSLAFITILFQAWIISTRAQKEREYLFGILEAKQSIERDKIAEAFYIKEQEQLLLKEQLEEEQKQKLQHKPPRRFKKSIKPYYSPLYFTDTDDPLLLNPEDIETYEKDHILSVGDELRQRGEKLGLSATAILLNYHRRDNLPLILRQLSRSRLFKEVIIWNNDIENQLKSANESKSPEPERMEVKVIDSQDNLGTIARYDACALANSPVCFVQDDDWDTSPYIHSLYGSFLREPLLIHSATSASVLYTHNIGMAYFNESIGLHTRHTWIGCGAFFLKEYAIRHAALSRRFLIPQIAPFEPLSAERNATKFADKPLFHCDIAFSLFRNAQPIDLIVPQLTVAGTWRDPISNGAETSRYMFALSKSVANIIKTALLSNDKEEQTIFSTQMPNPRAFSRTLCQNRYGRPVFPCVFNANIKHFIITQHDYGNAVDSNELTFWSSGGLISEGDWFGIDWLFVQKPTTATRVVFSHELSNQLSLVIDISNDGINWKELKHTNKFQVSCRPVNSGDSPIKQVISCLYSPGVEYTAIRFRNIINNNNQQPFETRIHEITLVI